MPRIMPCRPASTRTPTRTSMLALIAGVSAGLGAGLGATPAVADTLPRTELNLYGMPGLIDLPSAESMTDADLSTTISGFGGTLRYSLAFQIAPRLTGAFRYAYFGDADDPFSEDNPYWDRSFDLHYRFVDEGTYRPSIAVGVRDFIGTGLYSAEYFVATKTLPYGLKATAGIGWGRLAGRNSFDNPFGADDRPPVDVGSGGTADFDQFFRGPASLFYGLEWQPTDALSFAVEYSPDEYEPENERFDSIDPQTGVNVSMRYSFGPASSLGAYYMYGDEIGLSYSYTLNPKRSLTGLGLESPPPPFIVRPDRALNPQAWGTEWTQVASAETTLRGTISAGLEAQGLRLVGLSASADTITVEFENARYGQTSQALGRAARVLTNTAPASIETFVLIPVEKGMATTATTLKRSALEAQVFAADGVPESLATATTTDAGGLPRQVAEPDLFPRFRWNLRPYTEASFFDPRNPLLIDLGAQLKAEYEPVQGLIFGGAVRQKIVGNLDEMRLVGTYPPGAPPIVRSDAYEYAQYSDLTIPYLTAEYFFRPGENLYGRLTAGILEKMYGGVSGELLWKAPGNPLSLGVELNYAVKREFEQRFEFQDYDVTTGHASAYYDFGKGYFGQVDVGRYLAGDYGATFALERAFNNGTRIGAYATFTDVSFEEFGEGSFDKGIRITLPMDFLTGQATKERRSVTIRPILRDGGARLAVRNRLNSLVRDESASAIAGSWGRVWR